MEDAKRRIIELIFKHYEPHFDRTLYFKTEGFCRDRVLAVISRKIKTEKDPEWDIILQIAKAVTPNYLKLSHMGYNTVVQNFDLISGPARASVEIRCPRIY